MQCGLIGVFVLLVTQLAVCQRLPTSARLLRTRRRSPTELARHYRPLAEQQEQHQQQQQHPSYAQEEIAEALAALPAGAVAQDEADEQQQEELEEVLPQYLANDYSFLPDRMPDLADDEYVAVEDQSTPLAYLKQDDELPLLLTHLPRRSPVVPLPAGNPIYITVPIYINSAGQPEQTFRVEAYPEYVAAAEVAAEPEEEPAEPAPMEEALRFEPTSQFNRLLRNYQEIARGLADHRHESSRQLTAQPQRQRPRAQLPPERRVATPKAQRAAANYNFYF